MNTIKPAEDFRATIVTMTDGSKAHNVVGTIDQGAAGRLKITVACMTRHDALALADALNHSAWIEVEPEDGR